MKAKKGNHLGDLAPALASCCDHNNTLQGWIHETTFYLHMVRQGTDVLGIACILSSYDEAQRSETANIVGRTVMDMVWLGLDIFV